jgi:hypothetical protein
MEKIIEQFKNDVDILHTLVHDDNVSYAVFYAKLDTVMRDLAMKYWGNIPSPIKFIKKEEK